MLVYQPEEANAAVLRTLAWIFACFTTVAAFAAPVEIAQVLLPSRPVEIALSGDGSVAAVASETGSGTYAIWFSGLPSLAPLGEITSELEITSVDFGPDGNLVLYGTDEGGVFLHNRTSGITDTLRVPIPDTYTVVSWDLSTTMNVAMSPGGGLGAAAIDWDAGDQYEAYGGETLEVYDLVSKKRLTLKPISAYTSDLQWTFDGTRVLVASSYYYREYNGFPCRTGRGVRVFDVNEQDTNLIALDQAAVAVSTSGDNTVVLSEGCFGTGVDTVNHVTGAVTGRPFACDGIVNAVFMGGGEFIAIRQDSQIKIYRDKYLLWSYLAPLAEQINGSLFEVGSPGELLYLEENAGEYRLVVLQNPEWPTIAAQDNSHYAIDEECQYQEQLDLRWSRLTSVADWSARYGHATVVLNDALWIMGGNSKAAGKEVVNNDVYRTDNGTYWDLVTPAAPWSARANAATAVFKGRIWLVGGTNGGDEVWSSEDGVVWSQAPAPPWTPRSSSTAIVFDDELWVMGGKDNLSGLPINDVYHSPDGERWTRAGDPSWTPRYAMGATVFDGALWLACGHTADGYSGELWNSRDGSAWLAVPNESKYGTAESVGFATWMDRMWVLGGYGDLKIPGGAGDSAGRTAWNSSDGRTWRPADPVEAPFGKRTNFGMVTWKNKLWVLGGTDHSTSSPVTSISYSDVWNAAPRAELQSADEDADLKISLYELLRSIQLYNSLGYHCTAASTISEDGFIPGTNVQYQRCIPHTTDYNPQDWIIELPELIRLIQFYNSLGYHYCPLDGTEDGFCPGE